MANKRKNKRLNCLVPVDGKEGSIFDHTRTVDFSKRGLGIVSEKRLPKNKEIPLEIDFGPGEDPALVIGKVMWSRKIPNSEYYRVGIHFETILRGSKSRLDRHFQNS